MNTWAVIYEYCADHPNCRSASCRKTVVVQARIQIPEINLFKTLKTRKKNTLTLRMPIPLSQFLGFALLALGLGGVIGPMIPELRLEARYALAWIHETDYKSQEAQRPLPKSAPIVFEPLKGPDGTVITPISEDFSVIIPKIGVNAPVVANVNPTKPKEYDEALLHGVAHAASSFFPDQNGTVYLFSHSTNYEWFIKDLNAVFYLVKNLEKGDSVVLIYKGKRFTYRIADKQVVARNNTKYLIPYAGRKSLILETCWPPGSVAERLLIFADLIETRGNTI